MVIVGKQMDKLGKQEDFKAPWETESGTDAEIDKSVLKRLIFNLKLGEAKAIDAREEVVTELDETKAELATAKEDIAKASPDAANKRIEKLEAEAERLKAKISEHEAKEAKREEDDAREKLRSEVIGDLDPKYAKYVIGDDKEALEKSLEQVKADFGLDEEDEGGRIRSAPRSNLRNPGDNTGGGDEGEIDFDKVAADIIPGGVFG